jgi:hypothetical protein
LPIIALWTIGCLIAGISKNERFHAVWVILFPVSQISYTTIQLLKLG